MNGNSTRPQVIDAHDAANDIPSQIVENENFPYWFSIFIDNRCGFREEAICVKFVLLVIGLGRGLIEI